ncbi:YciI family protein [Tahibacter harae]|uniref:YciI family protein n=1 Tax=Tahibacter harae TaxID=2963937 RepID=A0ABT1QRV7_9GAMM|nr:YciI family protein [Tahibacter harae]MCQ4165030.1 YciI family protein [Tahibacter harae]
MRCLIIVKATAGTEAGVKPDPETTRMLAEMGKYNEALAEAGILLAAEGLHPSSRGVRVHFSGAQRTVVDGPFAETKELVAGFWLWQIRSLEEAVEWVRRCPNPTGAMGEIEIRPVFEAEDFGAALAPALREQEEDRRAAPATRH